MSVSRSQLAAFLAAISSGPDADDGAVAVEISRTMGSTPREKGAWMLVSSTGMLGTIGGGQLEYICIDNARQMLRNGQKARVVDVPLGPDIGQCCGGRVEVALSRIDAPKSGALMKRFDEVEAQNTPVYIMGAGHVGRALARAMSLLPVNIVIVDSRAQTLNNLPENVTVRLSALPEAEVRAAPARSAFVIVTHDHAEDFMIAREALGRGDTAYVGMIGSKTKRAAFASWLRHEGGAEADIERLNCPIGDHNLADKRPEVIAALVAAEIMVHTGRPFLGGGKDEHIFRAQVEGVL